MADIETRSAGVTLVELLIVIGLIAVLVLAFVVVRTRPAHEQARSLALAVAMQRWRSVQEGKVVVIRPTSTGATVVAARGHFTCAVLDGAPVILGLRPDVTVRWPSAALAFSADGRARRCDGGGAGNATIEMVDRHGNRAAVVVAALGRVRWERR